MHASTPLLLAAALVLSAAVVPLPGASAHVCVVQSPSPACPCPASAPHLHVTLRPLFACGVVCLPECVGEAGALLP